MTKEQFQQKKKDFKNWARNDAKHFIKDQNKYTGNSGKEETVQDFFKRCISVYGRERLMKQFDYSAEEYEEILDWYNECFWKGFEYWEKRFNGAQEVLQTYSKTFKEAEKIAKNVDVSDIDDGFPCGSVHLYLAEQDTDLAKALTLLNDEYDSKPYKYKLRMKMPGYGQCIDFDRKICEEVKDFLEEKGIPCLTHSWID